MDVHAPLSLRLLAIWSLALLVAAAGTSGCQSQKTSSSDKAAETETDAGEGPSVAGAAAGEDIEWHVGNEIEQFDPPSREDLEKVEWVKRPLLPSDAPLRQAKQDAPPPELTAAEALKLRNNSTEDNEKILTALSQLAPPDGEGVDYDARVVRHVTGDLGSTNPLFASTVTEAEYADMTSISPLAFDQNLDYFAPAETLVSWESSADGTMDRVVFRDDITWSDGKPFTAHDVAFTFQVVMTDHPELVIPAIKHEVERLKAVIAYDDHTVVYFHKEPNAIAYKNIQFPILPKHIYEKTFPRDPSMRQSDDHTRLEVQPVSCGPYILTSRKKNQEFVLKRREGYYMHEGRQVRPKPHFDEVRVKIIEDGNTALLALREGDIHIMELRAEQWGSQTDDQRFYKHNTKVYGTEWVEFHIMWNMTTPYFEDQRVRWAMTYAVDYEELLHVVFRGLYEQSVGNYHPTAWMFPEDGPEPIEQDIERAKALLDEAGWIDSDGDGFRDKEVEIVVNGKKVRRRIPFEFQLMTYTTESGIQTATLIKENLDRLGIVCHVKPTEFAAMVDATLKKKFDACMGGWGAGTDPAMNENIFGTGATRNYVSFSNPEVDELFKQGRNEFDREKRAEIYGRIHQLLWDAQPYTWLFYRSGFYGFNKRLRGYNFSPRGPLSYSPGFSAIYATDPPL